MIPSCLECQKRKIKCDRQSPCQACTARGEPEKCVPGNYKRTRAKRSKNTNQLTIQQLTSHIRRLESALFSSQPGGELPLLTASSESPPLPPSGHAQAALPQQQPPFPPYQNQLTPPLLSSSSFQSSQVQDASDWQGQANAKRRRHATSDGQSFPSIFHYTSPSDSGSSNGNPNSYGNNDRSRLSLPSILEEARAGGSNTASQQALPNQPMASFAYSSSSSSSYASQPEPGGGELSEEEAASDGSSDGQPPEAHFQEQLMPGQLWKDLKGSSSNMETVPSEPDAFILLGSLFALPPKGICDALLDSFFIVLHQFVGHIFHRPSFRTMVDTLYAIAMDSSKRQSLKPEQLALLFSVLAFTVQHLDLGTQADAELAERIGEIERSRNGQSGLACPSAPDLCQESSRRWAIASLHVLETADYMARKSLEVIQTLFLLSVQHLPKELSQRIESFSSIAGSHVKSMGLHRMGQSGLLPTMSFTGPTACINADTVVREEMCRRMFWSYTNFSGHLAFFSDGIWNIPLEASDTGLPCNCDDEKLGPQVPRSEHESTYTDMSYPRSMFRLVPVLAEMTRAFHPAFDPHSGTSVVTGGVLKKKEPDHRVIMELDLKLHQVASSWPEFYQMDDDELRQLSPTVGAEIQAHHGGLGSWNSQKFDRDHPRVRLERYFLHQGLYHKLIRLHRSSIRRTGSHPTSRMKVSASLAVKASFNLLCLQRRIFELCPNLFGFGFVGLQSITALMVLLLDLVEGRTPPQNVARTKFEIRAAEERLARISVTKVPIDRTRAVVNYLLKLAERGVVGGKESKPNFVKKSVESLLRKPNEQPASSSSSPPNPAITSPSGAERERKTAESSGGAMSSSSSSSISATLPDEKNSGNNSSGSSPSTRGWIDKMKDSLHIGGGESQFGGRSGTDSVEGSNSNSNSGSSNSAHHNHSPDLGGHTTHQQKQQQQQKAAARASFDGQMASLVSSSSSSCYSSSSTASPPFTEEAHTRMTSMETSPVATTTSLSSTSDSEAYQFTTQLLSRLFDEPVQSFESMFAPLSPLSFPPPPPPLPPSHHHHQHHHQNSDIIMSDPNARHVGGGLSSDMETNNPINPADPSLVVEPWNFHISSPP
ncbi:hypothetical protein IE53DRAFT_369734 [Violaceomyces palustris]|uniref:Uncharacterized protein n=1 Tax=Violaceomyces palustris TaxID=1673888 RepID=A0ACD0NUI5_9BASI|nr:hypothetical protein IE53DRAFT_369734 [Violaceomyces palustris]